MNNDNVKAAAQAQDSMQKKTRVYWEGTNKLEEFEKLTKYISDLLPEELKYIQKYNNQTRKEVGTLVLLVGYSLEPLLLSVCTWNPKRVVLIVNKIYGKEDGKTRYDDVKSIVNSLKKTSNLSGGPFNFTIDDFKETLPGDNPEDVFGFLRSYLTNNSDNPTIDITGGKKSMVAGAFLYAAYSNAAIAYVDFEDYDPKYQKPYGYLCKIRALDNPYQKFALRDWEQIQYMYGSYSFSAALNLLNGMSEMFTSESKFFEENHKKAVEKFKILIEIYQKWDSGAYHEAKNIYEKSKLSGDMWINDFKLPTVIKQFDGIFPLSKSMVKLLEEYNFLKNNKEPISKIREIGKECRNKILKNPSWAYFYSWDEIHKAKRLEDYRSAILRVATVSELLIYFRVILLSQKGALIIKTNENQKKDKYLDDFLEKMISDYISLFINKRWEKKGKDYSVILELEKLQEKDRKLVKSLPVRLFKILAEIRNQVVHNCMPIDEKELAEKCLGIAQENAQEFRQWCGEIEMEDEVYKIMPWNEIRRICGLDFIPEVRKN